METGSELDGTSGLVIQNLLPGALESGVYCTPSPRTWNAATDSVVGTFGFLV